ncbi:Protein bfr2 [Penicillium malachiteum]|uniref:Protein bfr2 n=1 Tax=Penicillium malachiteum TaxID=1324776 RepID=UPI002548694B|nr:Protein bfr2 [Penicillium malachiteum]KAJ5729500.1 Protein bfr2 [Penicillium malachiteum]
MAPGKVRSLADQLADLEDPTPKDFDPEDLERDGQSSDEEDGKTLDVDAGREHYQAVGKGKLRKQEAVELGKQYAGTRVSRDALDDDSDHDPFAARSDDEEMSDGDSDDSGAVSAEDGTEDSADDQQSDDESPPTDSDSDMFSEEEEEEELEFDSADEEESDDEDDEENDMESDEESDEEDNVPAKKRSSKSARPTESGPVSEDREELRRLMASDQKTIAATISQAAKADASKGKAVKDQRSTFDALLNTRIKLQKGLGSINDISALVVSGEESNESEQGEANEDAIKSAESAALALWSTLEELRNVLADAHAKDGSKKRKRPSPITPGIKSDLLWERMAELESKALIHRRANLDKWSSKVRGGSSSLPNARGKLLGSASGQQTITAVLDAHVATELGDRSSKRARQSNGADSPTAVEPVYDDTVFYQSLLRDLVEQRMSSSDAMTGGMDTLHQLPTRLPIHPITGMRNDKVKRDIDTRASKGRKMRFTVHEKLQNFMAPEDRGVWTGRAREEFFASLLGRSASGLLGEDDDSASDGESDREEGGLKLFRS